MQVAADTVSYNTLLCRALTGIMVHPEACAPLREVGLLLFYHSNVNRGHCCLSGKKARASSSAIMEGAIGSCTVRSNWLSCSNCRTFSARLRKENSRSLPKWATPETSEPYTSNSTVHHKSKCLEFFALYFWLEDRTCKWPWVRGLRAVKF